MRDIKYRGRELGTGKWVYGSLIQYLKPETTPDIYDAELAMYTAVNPETVGQYTGLKDKNGVEIYEGDVLRFRDGTCRAVAYDAEHTGFKLKDEDPVNPLWQMHSSMEVIGNIYENPELLESK